MKTNLPEREMHILHNPYFNMGCGDSSIKFLASLIQAIKLPSIIEFGTKRSMPDRATHSKVELQSHGVDCSNYIMSDIEQGADVDVIADLHKLQFESNSFDLIILKSVYEHLKYPSLATSNLLRVLKPGGVIYIATHQTFPLYGYPSDYYRFSRQALEGLFNPKMNCKVESSFYTGLCEIVPHEEVQVWNRVAESYLGVGIIARKTGETPNDFQFDI